MADLFDHEQRRQMRERLERLTPAAAARWGSMTAPELLAHLIDAFKITFKEKPVVVQRGFFSTAVGRWLVLRLPIPRGKIKAPAVFHETEPGEFDADRILVCSYLDRFAAGPQQEWGESPLFGRLSPQQWARLNLVHLRHHLAQFGV